MPLGLIMPPGPLFLDVSSGRIRWFPERLILLRNVKVRLRLDRRLAESTCVCQANLLKTAEIQFYSASLNTSLPQRSSFSGPAYRAWIEEKLSVSRNALFRKTHFSHSSLKQFLDHFFATLLPFSYILFNQEKRVLACYSTVQFRPV